MASQTEISTQKFEEKLKNKPKSLVFSRLADSYRKSGDVAQAISVCSEGLNLHPEYVTGLIILGRCYLEQENFNDAIKEFTKVCKLDRRNQIAIKMLADVFSKQGMEEKAGDLYNLLLKMDPNNPSVMHLANVFKGSNKSNLFEILGIEEDIKVETEPSEEPEEEKDELQEAQDVLDEIEGAEIDQAEAATEITPEEEAAVTEPAEEAVTTPEEAIATESAEETTAPESIPEEAAAAPGVSTEDAVPPEKEEDAAELEAITEDIEMPEAKSETEIQTEAISEEEPSIDDILSLETDAVSETPPMEDIKEEEDHSAEEAIHTVAKTEVITEVIKEEEKGKEAAEESREEAGEDIKAEELTEPEAVKEKEPTVAADQPDQEAKKTEEELPGGDDISARMGSMFGEESEELVTGISEIAESVLKTPVEGIDEISDVSASKDATALPEASEFTSRIEDMFGVEEFPEAVVAATEEGVDDTEITEPELLGISEDFEPSIEDVSDEKEISGAPTEVIDIEDRKKELVEEPLEIEEPPTVEKPEELVEVQKEEEDISDSSLTEATAVFDRDTLQKLTSTKTDELKEVQDTVLQEDKSSVSGEDVISRLDEMFSTETMKEEGGEIRTEPEDISKEPILDESAIFSEQQETLESKQAESIAMKAKDVDEQLSGEDVVSRIDEIFIEGDTIEGISIDTILDEEVQESKTATEFYTETGDTASMEDKEVIMEEREETPSVDDTVILDIPPTEELAVVDDETAAAEMSIDSISDEDIDEGDETGEFYAESGEVALKEVEVLAPEESIMDIPPSGEDVAASIENMFTEDQLTGDSSVDTIPDEDGDEKTTLGDGFYNVSGEEAETAVADESILSTLEEKEEKEPVPEDDEETFFYESDSSTEASPDQQLYQKDKELFTKAESIPDHVLTPTLADIYFQQDQPHLAIQIYKRLLERDPDNDKIADRIAEIERVIKEKEALIEKNAAEKTKRERKGRRKKSKSRKRRVRDDTRPLKGVRIKKEVKERIKRAKQELGM